MGIESTIYAGEQASRSGATYFRDMPASTNDKDWLLYHLSTASPVASFLEQRPERLAVNFHNITPAEAFAPWEPTIGHELTAARQQFQAMSPFTDTAIGVSQFNADEMTAAGYPKPSVAPVLFDPANFTNELDTKLDAKLQHAKSRGGRDWLFVGRVAPHKCQHDLIKAFALYRQIYEPDARLHIVGGFSSHRYWTVLHEFVGALQLNDAVDLTAGVSNGELGAYYRNADVFVCLSEHEGFGVPLLEAMHNNIPVVAFAAAAVPETVGDAAVLLTDKSPSMVAGAVDRVLHDSLLREAMVAKGQIQLSSMSLERGRQTWRTVIEQMVQS